MFGLGAQEIMLILLIAVFVFGGEKIPEMAKGLGKGLREFKRAMEQVDNEEKEQLCGEAHYVARMTSGAILRSS